MSETPTILIVDDVPANVGVLFDFLSSNGFEVLVARNGESALQIIETARPHLILLDIMMPGIDGFETCRRIKANKTTNEIPVIFMTALTDIVDKVKGFKLGAVDYVTKPFHQEEVLARVSTHLKIHYLQTELQDKNKELQEKEAALQKANKELADLVSQDGLTQIANRRRFDEYLQLQWAQMLRVNYPLTLMMCDVDFFKNYNDEYGHQAGDECLKQIATALTQCVKRSVDLVARYGGEEFALILPNTNQEGAMRIAEMIHQAIAQRQITHKKSKIANFITLSIGISSVIPTTENNPHLLISVADKALYRAKEQGRNQTVFQTFEIPPPL
ncbi:diguanylate cyclase domain-containing protein [Beggiatoa leptomitoformis]|uniref:diguanylate cyclase n=1 Tax=Beggiatoa leptomitoformis TaxID=288004 RepID=A0A2N9YAX8_9GAMM|nr:PleD family two-component system response regulator [Beggiatoa leptomitoformis]ALG67013.1 diguanylate cyclase [Beggiatoa leptomitoformis]AUI67611.1 diguanylate cyclase [Beggiatoa leptomitoformis]